jgi:leucyl/phenylalanyl-tRNA--protein transferase
VKLAERLKQLGFELIDCQVTTTHLARFGAREIPRPEFLAMLKKAISIPRVSTSSFQLPTSGLY